LVDIDTAEDDGKGEAEKSSRAMIDIDDGAFRNLLAFFYILDSINTNVSHRYRTGNLRQKVPAQPVFHQSNNVT
jgi:hypothetical protein